MLAQGLQSTNEGRDRRGKPRINVPFHVKVNGVDEEGEVFTVETVVDNVSGNGLYLRMIPCVELGAKMSIVLGLHTATRVIDEAPRFLIDGVVRRAEKKPGGVCGMAVTFDRVRFL